MERIFLLQNCGTGISRRKHNNRATNSVRAYGTICALYFFMQKKKMEDTDMVKIMQILSESRKRKKTAGFSTDARKGAVYV